MILVNMDLAGLEGDQGLLSRKGSDILQNSINSH
jgi:hypothetical protein